MAVIDGKFKRLRERKKRAKGVHTLKGESIPFVVSQVANSDRTWTITYNDGTVINAPMDAVDDSSGIPIGVQLWEYTHQEQVQNENVHITGTNNPLAMDDNIFANVEDSVRNTVSAAAQGLQQMLTTGGGWIVIGAFVWFVVLPMLNDGSKD